MRPENGVCPIDTLSTHRDRGHGGGRLVQPAVRRETPNGQLATPGISTASMAERPLLWVLALAAHGGRCQGARSTSESDVSRPRRVTTSGIRMTPASITHRHLSVRSKTSSDIDDRCDEAGNRNQDGDGHYHLKQRTSPTSHKRSAAGEPQVDNAAARNDYRC